MLEGGKERAILPELHLEKYYFVWRERERDRQRQRERERERVSKKQMKTEPRVGLNAGFR